MTMSTHLNHKEICKKIIRVFEEVVDYNNYTFPKNDNIFINMLETSKKIQDMDYISLDNLTVEDISTFMQILLDAFSLCAATGSKDKYLSNFIIKNLELLGSLKERRAKLLKTMDNEQIRDWFSCILLQGWINSNKEYPKLNVFDLDHDKRFKNSKKCDFKVDFNDENFELIECKRIHINSSKFHLSYLANKINSYTQIASNQINETERILNTKSDCRTVFVDIGSYNSELLTIDKYLKMTGFNKKGILQIKKNLFSTDTNGFINNNIDRIILTWKNIVFFNNNPIAIIQNSYSIILKSDISYSVDYKGWTIGLYTSEKNVKSIRVSSIAINLAWVKATCFSLNNQLLKYGKEEIKRK